MQYRGQMRFKREKYVFDTTHTHTYIYIRTHPHTYNRIELDVIRFISGLDLNG